MTNSPEKQSPSGKTGLSRITDKSFNPNTDPLEPLLDAIGSSAELDPYVKKIGARNIAQVMLNLVPFAPHDPNQDDQMHRMLVRSLGFVLDDGAPVTTTLDYDAFNFVCADTLTDELTDAESRGLFEALKNTRILKRVYQGPKDKNLLPGSVKDIAVPSGFPDTGRAAIPVHIHQLLTEYTAYLIHNEFARDYEDYQNIYARALKLMPEALSVKSLEQNEQGVFMFLREKSTGLIHFFKLSAYNLDSADPLTEIGCFHELTTAGEIHPDTFDSLTLILSYGFKSQKQVSKREGPNAYLGDRYARPEHAVISPKTGDAYLLDIRSAKIVKTGESMRMGSHDSNVPEPVVYRPGLNLVFIDEAPADQINLIIYTDPKTRSDKERLYRELFKKVSPATEIEFRNL
jgi:hypothetical protein